MNANVTVDAIEKQIAASKGIKTNVSFNINDYLDTKLKKGETSRKIKVRILPVSEEDSRFCVEIKTHSLKVDKKIAESGFKSFICLNDEENPKFDKDIKCPLCQKSFELFKRCKELKEEGKIEIADPLFKKACALRNKSTYIVRVIERGKENEGVKFWRFNKNSKGEGVFDKLISLYQNKRDSYKENGQGDNYNIFDLYNGRDIIITINRQFDKNGKELPLSMLVDASDFESPLSQDQSMIDKWVSDPKKWYNAYATKSVDYLKIIAEDEIPVKDENGNWIPYEENKADTVSMEDIQKECADILEDNSIKSNTGTNPLDNLDDLPF